MADPVRLAVIGCGRIAQVAHLPSLEKADGVEVVAVCDPSEVVAGPWPAATTSPPYTDQAGLLADEAVEAVLVAAPDRFHHAIATAALLAPASTSWWRSHWLRPRRRRSRWSTWWTGPGWCCRSGR